MPEALYLAAAAPVFTVGGTVRGELARDLLRLDVAEDVDGLKTLDARLLAAGGDADPAAGRPAYLDGAVLDFGREIEVSLGPPGTERTVFTGAISALEADFAEAQAPVVRLFAEDALMGLRMTRRSRTHRDASEADLVRTLAREHGLRAEVDLDGPTHPAVQQLDQSDLAFLRDRLRALSAELWFADGVVHAAARPDRAATSVTLVQGNDLLSVRLRADLAHQRTEVRVTGYDAQRREAIDEVAGGEVVQAEVAGGRTGPEVLRQAIGARATQRSRTAPLTGAEAGAWARAEMLRRARGFVTVHGTTSGTPDLVVGSRVRLERVGAPFAGDGYVATRVRHTYDLRAGLRTHFEAERPTVNG